MEHSPRIVHEPYGWEHPHEHELVERVPRDPNIEEPVRIYARVEGISVAPRIRWYQDGVTGWANAHRYEHTGPVESGLVPPGPSDDDTDRQDQPDGDVRPPAGPAPLDDYADTSWVGTIGPFPTSVPVVYEIVAGDHRAGPFSFTPAEYVSAAVHVLQDRFVLRHPATQQFVAVRCEVSPAAPREIRVRASIRSEADDHAGSPASSEVVKEVDGSAALEPPAPPTELHRLLLESAQLRLEGGTIVSVRLAWRSPSQERFFGLGERYDQIGVRGAIVESRVFDQYKHQGDRTYLPVPFFLSSLGYSFGVLSDHPVRFDLGKSDPISWSVRWNPESAPLDGVFSWGLPKELLARWQDHTGPASKPPSWCFEPWISSNEWNTQQRVMQEIDLAAEFDVPGGVIVLEAWSDEQTFYIWNGADYAPRAGHERFRYDDFSFSPDGPWPDPKMMINELHARGYKVILWQIPVQKYSATPHQQRLNDEEHVRERGFAVRRADGSEYRVPGPAWFPGSLVLDMSNDTAWDWWQRMRQYLVQDLGVDGFKTDGGEHLWGREFQTSRGAVGESLMNAYPREYASRYREFVTSGGARDGVVFSRAGYAGSQASTFFWNGDQDSTWEEFRSQFKATLNAGLSGIPFIGWDIGGFSGPIPEPELYLRSAQTSVFSPLMQLHSEYNHHRTPHIDRTPWNIADRWSRPDVLYTYRAYAKLRMHLAPYLDDLAADVVRRGLPLVAPLFVHYPEDQTCWRIGDQYLLGEELVVAPVLSPAVYERMVYLPKGSWTDCWTGEVKNGGRWISVHAPLHKIPLYGQGRIVDLVRPALAELFVDLAQNELSGMVDHTKETE